MIILGTNSIKETGFNVDNSVRFNGADNAYMHKTPSGAGNRKKFTISCWIKKARGNGAGISLFNAYAADNDAGHFNFNITGAEKLDVTTYSTTLLATNRLFKDTTSWYHLMCAVDTTLATADNRVRLYVNGIEETSFATRNNPTQDVDLQVNNTSLHNVGVNWVGGVNETMDGYMAEMVFIDNAQLTPTSFGEFDEDSPTIWKPIDVSELTFGTNGFYLDFKDSANLGNDANGGTDLTEVNLAATDQSTDTCTNNFTSMNILQVGTGNWVFSEGNSKVAIGSGTNWKSIFSNFGVANGKWYYEVKVSGNFAVGIGLMGGSADSYTYLNGSDADGGGKTDIWRYRRNGASAYYSTGSTSNSITPVPANDDIIGIAYNADAGAIYSSINGSWQNSATIAEIAAGTTTNALFDDITTGVTFAIFGSTENANNLQFNFGGSPAFAVSSGNADGNGYGNFEYTVPTNFYSICTKNLAEYG